MTITIRSQKEAIDFAKTCKVWDAYVIDVYPVDPEDVWEVDHNQYAAIQKIIEDSFVSKAEKWKDWNPEETQNETDTKPNT